METDEGNEQLVASEASAGIKGGGGDDSKNARHASRKEGTGDLSSGDPEATLKSRKRKEDWTKVSTTTDSPTLDCSKLGTTFLCIVNAKQ